MPTLKQLVLLLVSLFCSLATHVSLAWTAGTAPALLNKWTEEGTNKRLPACLPACSRPCPSPQVCADGSTFAIINQKGIDPGSLDMLAKEGILALR